MIAIILGLLAWAVHFELRTRRIRRYDRTEESQ